MKSSVKFDWRGKRQPKSLRDEAPQGETEEVESEELLEPVEKKMKKKKKKHEHEHQDSDEPDLALGQSADNGEDGELSKSGLLVFGQLVAQAPAELSNGGPECASG